ncbi:MAG TPA: hypothetical protein VF719_01755, partial [Abditibacteriaceae bacterium]
MAISRRTFVHSVLGASAGATLLGLNSRSAQACEGSPSGASGAVPEAAATSAPAVRARRSNAQSDAGVPACWKQETYAALLNTKFRARAAGSSAKYLRLAEVKSHEPAAHPDRAQSATCACFSLTFVGPASGVSSQETYRITHPEIGAFDLFLVSSGPEKKKGQRVAQYTAFINRI